MYPAASWSQMSGDTGLQRDFSRSGLVSGGVRAFCVIKTGVVIQYRLKVFFLVVQ